MALFEYIQPLEQDFLTTFSGHNTVLVFYFYKEYSSLIAKVLISDIQCKTAIIDTCEKFNKYFTDVSNIKPNNPQFSHHLTNWLLWDSPCYSLQYDRNFWSRKQDNWLCNATLGIPKAPPLNEIRSMSLMGMGCMKGEIGCCSVMNTPKTKAVGWNLQHIPQFQNVLSTTEWKKQKCVVTVSGCETVVHSDVDGFYTDGVSCWQEARNANYTSESCLQKGRMGWQERWCPWCKFRIWIRQKQLLNEQQSEQIYFGFHYVVETPTPMGVPLFYIMIDNHPETWFTLVVRVQTKKVEPNLGIYNIVYKTNKSEGNEIGQIRRYRKESVIKLALLNHSLLNVSDKVRTVSQKLSDKKFLSFSEFEKKTQTKPVF